MTVPAVHFIFGLTRAGSTLLASLLRQKPVLHANINSPVGSMVTALLGDISAGNERAAFFTQARRESVLRGVLSIFYDTLAPGRMAFERPKGCDAGRRASSLRCSLRSQPEGYFRPGPGGATWASKGSPRPATGRGGV